MKSVLSALMLFSVSASAAWAGPSTPLPVGQSWIDGPMSDWMSSMTMEPVTEGNRVEFYNNGTEFFPLRMDLIRNAKAGDTIDLQIFLWCDDEAGIPAAEELVKAHQRGVRVRLLIDWGNIGYPHKEVYRILREGGVSPLIFNPPYWGLGKINNGRSHEKIMLVNGEVALLGGANLCSEYMTGIKHKLWHDFEIHARGPVVAQIQARWDENWNWSVDQEAKALWFRKKGATSEMIETGPNGQPLDPDSIRQLLQAEPTQLEVEASQLMSTFEKDGSKVEIPQADLDAVAANLPAGIQKWPPTEASAQPQGDAIALFELSQPYRARSNTKRFLTYYNEVLKRARKRVILYSPYFVTPPEIENTLMELAKKGVQVFVMTNSEKTDDSGKLVAEASYAHYPKVLKSGVRIFEEQLTTQHAKGFLIDDTLLSIGSHNFDMRSFYLQGESALLTGDQAAIQKFERVFEEDLQTYREVTAQAVKQHRHNAWNRIIEVIASWFRRLF